VERVVRSVIAEAGGGGGVAAAEGSERAMAGASPVGAHGGAALRDAVVSDPVRIIVVFVKVLFEALRDAVAQQVAEKSDGSRKVGGRLPRDDIAGASGIR
jgi:hypothetical protein